MITVFLVAQSKYTEVVASLKSREELLGFLFSLMVTKNILAYFSSRNTAKFGISGLFFAVSILTKMSTLIFLGVIPLLLWFFKRASIRELILPMSIDPKNSEGAVLLRDFFERTGEMEKAMKYGRLLGS